MKPEGDHLLFNETEVRLGFQQERPASEAFGLLLFALNQCDVRMQQIQEAQMDPRTAIKGTKLDLALDLRALQTTAHQLGEFVLSGSDAIKVDDALRSRLASLGELDTQ